MFQNTGAGAGNLGEGTYFAAFFASNGYTELAPRVTFNVVIPNAAPTAVNDSATVAEDGSVTIMDWTTGQALSLLPDSKTALRMNLGNEAKELDSFNAFQAMRDSLASSLEAGGLKDVESLGKKTFDGRELIGFRIQAVRVMTIWADPETEVAVQIEIQLGDNGPSVMMKNYESDFPVDEALFSLDIPAGYQTTDMKLPTSQPSEAELIKSLKLSCESGDGTFPKGLDITSIANASANIQVHLIDSMNLGSTAATG